MWSYARFTQACLLFAFAARILSENLVDQDRKLTRQKIYMEIMKNITQVNEILKELLLNYRQEKTSYDNKVNFKNELSSDSAQEVVESSSSIEKHKAKHNKKSRYHDIESRFHSDEKFYPVTQIIPYEESDKSSNDKSDDNQGDNGIQTINNTVSKLEMKKEYRTKARLGGFNFETDIYLIRPNDAKQINAKPNLRLGSHNENFVQVVKDNYLSDIMAKKFKRPRMWLNAYQQFPFQYFVTTKPFMRYPAHKTVILILSNRNTKQEHNFIKENQHDLDLDKLEEVLLRRDRKALRDVYGQSCLDAAVRKCYKALQSVRKMICELDFKCRSSFKETFRSYAKTGCMKEFQYENENKNESKMEDLQHKRRYKKKPKKLKKLEFDDDIFDDISRSGMNKSYCDVCLPLTMTAINTQESMEPDSKVQPVSNLYKPAAINILRDHYENECKRSSKARCVHACTFAFHNTCSEHTCVKSQKKLYKKNCNSECKYAFGVSKTSSDSSDSDSDSDSGSGSDGSESSSRS